MSTYEAQRARRRRQIAEADAAEDDGPVILIEDADAPEPGPASLASLDSSGPQAIQPPVGIPSGVGRQTDRRGVVAGIGAAAAAALVPATMIGSGERQALSSHDPVAIALPEIRRYEGWKGQPVLFAYDEKATTKQGPVPLQPGDPVRGRITIGWGRAYGVRAGDRITAERADAMLLDDVEKAMTAVDALEAVCIRKGHPAFAPEVAAALCSFAYNIGWNGLANTRSVAGRMKAGDYLGAAQGLSLYIYSDQELMTGLVRRRERERKMFLAGLMAASTAAATEVAMNERATPSRPEKPLAQSSTLRVSAGGVMSSMSTFIASVSGVAPQYQGVLLLVSFVILLGVIAYNCSERVRKFLTGEGW